MFSEDTAAEKHNVQDDKAHADNDACDQRREVIGCGIRSQEHEWEPKYDGGKALIYEVFAGGGTIASVDFTEKDHARACRACEHAKECEELFMPVGGE